MGYAASSARELDAKPRPPREETTVYVDRVTLGMKYVLYDKGDEMFQELVEKDEELIKMPVVFADEPGSVPEFTAKAEAAILRNFTRNAAGSAARSWPKAVSKTARISLLVCTSSTRTLRSSPPS
jgi:hypothetical protein